MRIVVLNHVTLDGVMQGPGRADEDTRHGFTHGGWAEPYGDEVMGRFLGQRMTASGGLLLGRRSYQDMLAYWNTQDSPYRDALNNAPKYVAATTLSEPPPWPNTTLLTGDVPAAVAELKATPGNDVHIMGSGVLIRSLSPLGLIDEYMLCIYPLVLGIGHRLFADGFASTSLTLADSTTTTKGVIIATYRTPLNRNQQAQPLPDHHPPERQRNDNPDVRKAAECRIAFTRDLGDTCRTAWEPPTNQGGSERRGARLADRYQPRIGPRAGADRSGDCS